MNVQFSFSTDNRGVSNTLGFAFTFALIVIAAILIFTSGVGSLDTVQEDTNEHNAVTAFELFSDNITEIHRWGAPSRSTEIRLSGGEISILNTPETTTEFTYRIENQDTGEVTVHEARSFPIQYELSSGARIVYDSGLLSQHTENTTRVVQNPPFMFSEDHSSITIVSVRGAGAVSGNSNTLLVGTHQQTTIPYDSTSNTGESLVIEITVSGSEQQLSAWNEYLSNEDLQQIDGDISSGEITYEYTTTNLVVRDVMIEFSLEN